MSGEFYKTHDAVTMPWKQVNSVNNTVVIDSRQRDCNVYKNPSEYIIPLGEIFKNINSIELKGAIIPKSSYNIHSSNNKIDFSIGDFVSGFKIINGGGGYTSAPAVYITQPSVGGTTATATAVINLLGQITNIIIGVAGSGYTASKPPALIIANPTNSKQAVQPRISVIIGDHYTATLREGEYEIGGNLNPPATLPTNLLLEIQNAMNYEVIGGNYDPVSVSPFVVLITSSYPELGAIAGTPEASNTNSCKFNRIQIVNVNSVPWEFLWCSGPNTNESAFSVLGFDMYNSGVGILIPAVITPGLITLIPAGTAIRGTLDFNLKNDPDYVILSIYTNGDNKGRINSVGDDGLNEKFCVLLFDNNNPETLHDLTNGTGGSTITIGGIDYLQGPLGKETFCRDYGAVKPIKGGDFDGPKKLTFAPPLGKLSTLRIKFTKFGKGAGNGTHLYPIKDHTLLFELGSSDNASQMKY